MRLVGVQLVSSAATAVADASAAMRLAADEYVAACEAETEALDEMNSEIIYEPPLTLSKDDVAGYNADVTHLQTDANIFLKYAPVIRTTGEQQVATTASYLAEGENLKSAVTQLQGAFEDQMHTQHHIKEAITRCQPTVACVPSPCTEVEPSNPCEPWPSCYPHPCHPWPSCAQNRRLVEASDPVTPTSSSPAVDASTTTAKSKSPPGSTSTAPLLAASMAEVAFALPLARSLFRASMLCTGLWGSPCKIFVGSWENAERADKSLDMLRGCAMCATLT